MVHQLDAHSVEPYGLEPDKEGQGEPPSQHEIPRRPVAWLSTTIMGRKTARPTSASWISLRESEPEAAARLSTQREAPGGGGAQSNEVQQ